MREYLDIVKDKLRDDYFEYVNVIDVSRFEEPTYSMFEVECECNGEYLLITFDDRDRLNGYASIDFHIPTSRAVVESECYSLIDEVLGDGDSHYPLDEIKEFSNRAGDVYDEANRYFVQIGCSELKDAYNSVPSANTDLFHYAKRVVLQEDVLKTLDFRELVTCIQSSRNEVASLFENTVMFRMLGL